MGRKLYLLDGMALLYRAHFAFRKRPFLTTGGMDVSALFGFVNSLVEILEKHSPTHMAVALDTPEPTDRHREYPAYKAQREAIPEALSECLAHVDDLCGAFRIPLIRAPGYEADDIVGTLARRAQAEGFEVFMVTPDKDFAQLVSDRVRILKPGKGGAEAVLLGLEEVLEEWGVEHPGQVVDVLGLWGDVSDNIPGVPGIGQKTGARLIRRFGSLENLLGSLDQLKGKQRESLERHRGDALQSKRLARIVCDVPLDIGLEDLEVKGIDRERMKAFCVRFEFNAIGRRLLGEEFHAGRSAALGEGAVVRTIDDVETRYRCLSDPGERKEALERLGGGEALCFDVETTGLDPGSDLLLGCALSAQEHRAFYLPLVSYDGEGRMAGEGGQDARALEDLARILEDPGIAKVGHNLKFDMGVLRQRGIRVGGRCTTPC